MAYLNVPARRIETKIAYVGPGLSGKTTNLQRLHLATEHGRAGAMVETLFEGAPLFALDWRPNAVERISDCELAVRLLAARGELTAERLDALLGEVDGVVVVVDAAPAAQEENRRALALVKDALGATSTPVVVQLNKCDLDGALDAGALAATLPVDSWPVVRASAARGEGVVETLDAAVRAVVDALRATGVEATPPAAMTEERAQNPLLAALREILRETVREHMAHVEGVTLRRVSEAIAGPLAALEARVEASTRVVSGLATQLASIEATAKDAATRSELAGADARVREEIAARARAEREHVTAALSVVKRAVDVLGADVKKVDGGRARDAIAGVGTTVERMSARVDALCAAVDGAAKASREASARADSLEVVLTRELRDTLGPKLGRIDEGVHLIYSDAVDSLQRADARVAEVKVVLDDLIEKMKQQKKGWFG